MSGIGGLVIKGIIWLVAVVILAYGVDERKRSKEIKADAGAFFLFLLTTGVLGALVFGFKLI